MEASPILETPIGQFRWIEDWVKIPESPLGLGNGRTHGVVEVADGRIFIFHQADPAMLMYSSDGALLGSWGRYPGAHGLTRVEEDGAEFLWLTDQDTQEVHKTDLDGNVLLELKRPDLPIYDKKRYVPTWVAVNEKRFGGDGHAWVTDGYGSHYIHRYDPEGNYLMSITGEEGPAGVFECPHGIWIGPRGGVQEFYIADRTNRRVQVYTTEGEFVRVFGEGLTSPDMFFTMHDGQLLVPELQSRLTILGPDDQPVAILGEYDAVSEKDGWPNDRALIVPGKCNSPHAAAVDRAGNLYLVEWITGGRVTKLERVL